MDKKKKNLLNIDTSEYELLPDVDKHTMDGRFKKVKIWVAHTGENLNATAFSRESLLKLSETLPYTPIVGYVKKDENGEDFLGHEREITIDRDGMTIEYLGVPYGFVPENPNEKIELREGKEWLTTEGYLWTKFDKSLNIFDNANGRKSQSMEIEALDGYTDENGVYNIENSVFSALCILGEGVRPAMQGSTIEFFEADSLRSEIANMFKEFTEESKDVEEGGAELDTENKKDEATEEEVKPQTEEQFTEEETKESEVVTEEEFKAEDEESKAEEETKEEAKEESDEEEFKAEEFKAEETETNEENKEEESFADEDEPAETEDDDEAELKQRIAELEEENASLKQEVEELRSQNDEFSLKEKQEKLKSYSDKLSEDSYKALQEQLDNFTVIELEKEIGYTIFKESESKETGNSYTASVDFSKPKDGKDLGVLNRYFNK